MGQVMVAAWAGVLVGWVGFGLLMSGAVLGS